MADDDVRVWLVERTLSDDEQNIVILVYATPDGEQYLRKERALTSGEARESRAALTVEPDSLAPVIDHAVADRYAAEAVRMAEAHDPDDAI